MHGTTLLLINLYEKRIIMGLAVKSHFCILTAYKNKSKIQIQYLCIPLSVGAATLCRHCPLWGPLMSTPLHSVADEWRNNRSPGGSHFPWLAQSLIWFAPAWGTDSVNNSGLRRGVGSPYEVNEGTGIQFELNSLYPTLGSRLGTTQGISDNDIKGTFRRLFIVRKWRPWMVTELEWGPSRWCVCLVNDHCGHSMGAKQGDSPFFLRRCSSFKEARESSKLHQLRPHASPSLFPCNGLGTLKKPVAVHGPPVKGDKSNCVYCTSYHSLIQVAQDLSVFIQMMRHPSGFIYWQLRK